MAADEALDVMEQIESLVADRLQVVSYKWLSRNFSIASDDAKRMLQNFVEKNGSELESVYALSGWLKDDPHTYHIKLVPAIKLSEAKKKFKDNCSVQVYSVQACIPKDPAILWNAEFVQAEELFDQPTTTDNCLRDNRFCAIINSFVKRNIEGKCGVSADVSKDHIGMPMASKTDGSVQNLSAQPHQKEKSHQPISNSAVQSSTDIHTKGKNTIGAWNTLNLDKEKKTMIPISKLKFQSDMSHVNGGSLGSLWGCANTKQKQSSPGTESINDVPMPTRVNKLPAYELLGTVTHNEKEQNCGSGRKRMVVFDYSDDEAENEDVVSLASPGPPTRHSIPDYKGNDDGASLQNKNVISCEQSSTKREIEHEKKEDSTLGLSAACNLRDATEIKGGTIPEKTEAYASERSADKDNVVGNVNPASLPKRKKVLKTRIDDRGREVTEVVWEEQGMDGGTAEKNTVSNIPGSRHTVIHKATSPATSAPSNPVGKAGNKKSAKGGKDAKQGNILSFFKKI